MRREWIATAAAALFAASTATQAAGLATINESALSRAFALPALGEPRVLPAGEDAWTFSFDLANEFVEKQDGDEALRFDGESQRWNLRYRRGWGTGFEWGVEVPVIHLGGGFLDGAIENWHDTFNLPNNHRDESSRDRIDYRYVRDGVTELAVDDGGTGLGDVRATAGWALTPSLAWRGLLKFPTGDDDILAGGNAGGATWLDWALPFPEGSGVSGFLSGGVSAQEDADALKHLQNTVVPFGGVGAGWQVFSSFEILTQFYLHGPLYRHTQLGPLQDAGLQWVLGGRWCPSAGPTCVELSFTEDPVVGVSPDFSVRAAVVVR